MKYEQIKKLEEEKFRRLTGVKRSTLALAVFFNRLGEMRDRSFETNVIKLLVLIL